MKLLDSLLDAIVRLEGDALVMHVGEKPYVVTASSSMNAYRGPLAWGQVELSSRVLTFDAVSSMLGQILPADQQVALTEFGAIEHDIPSPVGVADRFTVIAARGGEDVWVELRRRPIEIPQAQAPEPEAQAAETPVAEAPAAAVAPEPAAEPVAEPAVEPVAEPAVEPVSESVVQQVAEPVADIELHEIELTVEPDASLGEQPAADIQLEAHESIVVAIPGQAAEEFALNGVPDNAIQIIDDEPQGVPTEEEVDAMLAATDTSMLASGLAGEVVSDEETPTPVAFEVQDDVDAQDQDDETEIDLTTVAGTVPVPVSEAVADVDAAVTEPAWQLSPPPAVAAEVEPAAETEVVGEVTVGAPLFSEEAVLAAAPSYYAPVVEPGQMAEPFEAAQLPPAVETTPHFETPAYFAPPVETPPAYAPVSELGPLAESAPIVELPPPVESQPHFEVPPYFAPVVVTPAYHAPVAELGPIAEATPVTELLPAVESTPHLEAPPHFVPVPEVALIVEPAPMVEAEPVVEFAPIAEPAPMSEAAPVVEFAPAIEVAHESASVVEVEPDAEPAPIPELPPGEALSPVVEASFDQAPVEEVPAVATSSESAPIGEAPIAEQWVPQPVVEEVQTTALVFVPTPATEPAFETVASALEPMPLEPMVEPAEFAAPPLSAASALVDARIEESGVDAVWMPDAEFVSPPHHTDEDLPHGGDEMHADDGDVNTMNAGAEPAVSEPTPQLWTPPAPEMPMEVTPELQGQEEPVANVAHWAAASPETPLQEVPEPVSLAGADSRTEDEMRHGVVVPLARTPIKPEPVSVPFTPSEDAALMHTLRVAAARGASTVYVVAQSKPMIRIDGEIGPLESEPTLTAADVDRLVMELAPPRRRDALQNGPVEWLCDVPEIGRVRCMTFKDHRGPGVLFRMFPPRAISADQLGLTPEVQALCQQSDGLVLVTGARASGKSTLLNAFVDLINRTRSDHVITIESQIGFVHESRRSFISQRESRGDSELAATYARAALREDPDVMMIEDLKSAELVSAALEAAESGRLVLASVPASSTIGALERLIEVFPADRRATARTSLATALRGVIAQVLLRRAKGGRVAAREILLNTPGVSQLVLEGKMFQLPVALDSGRRHGMVPLTDSLAAHVRDGTVQVAEAYRKALDRAALVALLKREGIDTSFAERLA